MGSCLLPERSQPPSARSAYAAFNAAGAAVLAAVTAALVTERVQRRRDGLRRATAYVEYRGGQHLIGAPCVVFEAGANSWSTVWGGVSGKLAPFARSFAYDRPGLGRVRFAGARSVAQHACALRATLQTAGACPPYVLVAHSLGALYVNAMLQQLPRDQVLGVVYVDGASPETVTQLRSVVPSFVPPKWLAFLLSSFGVLRALAPLALKPYADAFRVDQRLWGEARAVWARAGWLQAYASEWCSAMVEADEGAKLSDGWLGSLPISVIIPDIYERTEGKAHIARLQARLASYSSDAKLIRVEQCGHFVQLDRPDVIVAAVRDIVERAGNRKSRKIGEWNSPQESIEGTDVAL